MEIPYTARNDSITRPVILNEPALSEGSDFHKISVSIDTNCTNVTSAAIEKLHLWTQILVLWYHSPAYMKVTKEQIRLLPNESFRVIRWKDNVRDVELIDTEGGFHPFRGTGDTWHSHSEMELVLVTSGAGTRFLGDSIAPFKAVDLVLVGSNLPHHWQGDSFSGYALQFNFGNEHPFWKLKETQELRTLWSNAQKGIRFSGMPAVEVAHLIKSMTQHGGIGRFGLFMLILEKLAKAAPKTGKLLSKKSFPPSQDHFIYKGIQKAINLLLDNFQEELDFVRVVKEAGMSKATFERQFKKHTGKTFTQFITEVRLDHASRLLVETDQAVSEIAFSSGFNNLSYFNLRFGELHHESPRAFRKRMKKAKMPGRQA